VDPLGQDDPGLDGGGSAGSRAIAVDAVFVRALECLKQGREVEYGYLGIQAGRGDWDAGTSPGVRVDRVLAGTPASRGKLRRGDVITHVDRQPVDNEQGLVRLVAALRPGDSLQLTVIRDGKSLLVETAVTKFPVAGRKVITNGPAAWRGLAVDFPAAVIDLSQAANIPDRCVAASRVDRDSPAWRAGLRRGTLVSHLGGRPLESPEAFYAAAQAAAGNVQVLAVGLDGKPRPIIVAATGP
jgi:S1-C subfamily serine protease